MAKVLVQAVKRAYYGEVMRHQMPDGSIKVFDTHKLYDPDTMTPEECRFWVDEEKVSDFDKVEIIKGAKGNEILRKSGWMKRLDPRNVQGGFPQNPEPLVVAEKPSKGEEI